MNVLWSKYPSHYRTVPIEALADLVHPLAAVYWDRDSADFGDLVTAETLGPGPETCLRFITQPKTGYTLVFTDKLGQTRFLAAWHDDILRWMPVSEFNYTLTHI